MTGWGKRIVAAGVAAALVFSLGACRKEVASVVLPQAGAEVAPTP